MTRTEEIRKLQELTPVQMKKKAGKRLIITKDIDMLHKHFAQAIFDEIAANNKKGRLTKMILPVGPLGQYPILKDMINKKRLSLKNCYFFYMDENCDDTGHAIPKTHPLSFRGEMEHLFFKHIDPELNIPGNQLIFPSHLKIQTLEDRIKSVGGIDTCYGGIGIHGHVAFNEPEKNVRSAGPRLVYLNDFTITINAIRSEIGGNLEAFPRKAVTLGMKQILGARRIRLYCRNDIPGIDWANTVLRLAVFGKPGDDYPVTYCTKHKDYVVVTDRNTAASPRIIL